MGVLHVSTMVGMRDKQPKVDIVDEEKEWRVQLSVGEARALALNILQAAEAALVDGFIFDWVTRAIELDEPRASMVLNEFREYRGHHEAWPKVTVTE